MRDYFDIPDADDTDRAAVVERHMARLRLAPPAPDEGPDPKLRLAAADELFGVWRGCFLGAPPPPRVPPYTAGDGGQGGD